MSASEDSAAQPAPAGQPKAGDRRRARALAMQGLYQRHFSKSSITDIESEFIVDNDMSKVDAAYFRDLLRGVHREQAELDRLLEPFLDRPIHEVDAIELAIVRLGAYELKHRLDVPYKVKNISKENKKRELKECLKSKPNSLKTPNPASPSTK